MNLFAPRRLLTPRGPAWRCLQQVSRAPAWRCLQQVSRAPAWRCLQQVWRAPAWRCLQQVWRAPAWRCLQQVSRAPACLVVTGPAWRCLQQVPRAPACLVLTGQQNLDSDSTKASVGTWLFLRPVPTNGLLSHRSPSGPTSRLCHGRQSGNPEREDGGNATNNEGFGMRALSQAPRPALYLGFAGLVPFLSAPLLMAATQSFYPEVAYGQMVYGACIVSFLGGARWGFALPESSPAKPDWMNLGNSVVPSLLAWLALLCKDNITEGALVVIMGLGLSLHYDLTLLPGYPGWFKAMRTVLTLVATFSLVATLTMKKCCTEKKLKELQN